MCWLKKICICAYFSWHFDTKLPQKRQTEVLPSHLELCDVCNHVGQKCIAGDIEGHPEAHVTRALVQLTRQLAVGHVELAQSVAGRQSHVGQVCGRERGIFTNTERCWRHLSTPVMNHLWGSRHTWWSAGPLDSFWWCRWPSAVGRHPVLYNLSKEFHILIQGSATDGKQWGQKCKQCGKRTCMHICVLGTKVPPLEPVHRAQVPLLSVGEPQIVQEGPGTIGIPNLYPFLWELLGICRSLWQPETHHFMLSQPCRSIFCLFKSSHLDKPQQFF